jgi:hypothetical protein
LCCKLPVRSYCGLLRARKLATEEEVLQIAKKLKIKSSAGYDEIPDMIVTQCIHIVKTPSTFIINLSLSSGIFPNQMKIAKVRPIFKKRTEAKY